MKINDFTYDYYSGVNVSLKLFNLFTNKFLLLDSVGISYNINYGSIPIYSYCSELYDAVLRGREMVQGTLVLNHTSARLISDFLNEAKSDKVGISFLNSAPFIMNISFGKSPPVILKDCVIISRGQTIQIDSSNILEEYNFVGKEMLQQSLDTLFPLQEIKKINKRVAFLKGNLVASSEEESNKSLVAGVSASEEPETKVGSALEAQAPVPVETPKEIPPFIDNNKDLGKRGISNDDLSSPAKNTAVSPEVKAVTPQTASGVKNEQATIQVKEKKVPLASTGYQINKVKGRADSKEFEIKSPFDPALLQDSFSETKTKTFLNNTFANKNEEVNQEVKDMLTYMVSKERRGLTNNGREPLANELELEREQAALLWTATNRMKIKDIVYTQNGVANDSKPRKDQQLLQIFNQKNWASYSNDYVTGKYSGAYNDPKNTQIKNTVDRFFSGDLPNEIFTNTNFVHANDNLKTVPSWSLDSNQSSSGGIDGTSGYEPIYVGNAIFSYGYNNYYPTLENEYLWLYPEYYNNPENYMQKRLYKTAADTAFGVGQPGYYEYNGTNEASRPIFNPDEKEETTP